MQNHHFTAANCGTMMHFILEGGLLFGLLGHSAHSAKVDSAQKARAEQAVEASRVFYTYREEPAWLSTAVRHMFNVSSRQETSLLRERLVCGAGSSWKAPSLLSIKTDADLSRRNDDEAVQIYYSNGFFGSMSRGDFSQQCGFPCVRASFPNSHAEETADAFMVFPIDPKPPTNRRGAVALGHTQEALALYGGKNAHNYEAMADMSWRSTVPWTYFDPVNIRKSHSQRVLNSAPWEARKPAAVFVARNCGGTDRNSFISQLIAHGVEVDSISACKPGGSRGGWPAGVPHSDKMGALQKYRVYLALENRKEEGYVTEKVADGLMSGAATVYLGAPDIDNYVPDTALINANNYNQDMERIVSQIKKAIDDKTTWESHRSWLKQSPEQWNQGKILKAFSYSDGKPAECRLCRYAYSKRMGLGWDWGKQQPAKGSVPPNGDKFWKTWPSVKHA
eukprot:TRINITY_DN16942_c0_g1_i2.p1 TRINITY_DN16942_c0_g1~~TRINITY_DN16942_c0_g1_i2.p1  ORF type:complete len:449 (-),score=64.65 TRINITY_DN16942_c0_g1_i2:184-1530(-)